MIVKKIIGNDFVKKPIDDLKIVRNYINGTNNVSYRKYKKALDRISDSKDPEALTVASSIQKRTISDQVFQERRINLLNKAIDLEFAPAMVAVAESYYHKKDYEQAFKLYERAAKLNNAHAIRELAFTYENGFYGFKKDKVRAEALRGKIKNGIVWNMDDGFDAQYSDYE